MKRLISVLILLLSNIGFSFGADKYEIGDSLYVWASSGLNVRNGPSTNYSIESKIQFGEVVFILEKSNFKYNVTGIANINSCCAKKNTTPIIFYGNWVKVRSKSGAIGFVIDQYLINLEPKNYKPNYGYTLKLIPTSIDTINRKLLEFEGGVYEYTTKTHYNKNISSVSTFGGYSGNMTFTIENYTFEEVLIIFSSAFNNYIDFEILQNWEEEILFSDIEQCSFSLKRDRNKIIFYYSCSC